MLISNKDKLLKNFLILALIIEKSEEMAIVFIEPVFSIILKIFSYIIQLKMNFLI